MEWGLRYVFDKNPVPKTGPHPFKFNVDKGKANWLHLAKMAIKMNQCKAFPQIAQEFKMNLTILLRIASNWMHHKLLMHKTSHGGILFNGLDPKISMLVVTVAIEILIPLSNPQAKASSFILHEAHGLDEERNY